MQHKQIMITTELTSQTIWDALDEVKDPEIPVVSLVEMGIISDVEIEKDKVIVTMTPTFSGCPALVEMQTLIHDKMLEIGAQTAEVKTVLKPAWSSDRITAEGRRKLKEFGLAPPPIHGGDINVTFFDIVECPRCDSKNTTVKNTFGSTLCRAIYYCNECQEPFEQFKPL